MKYLILALCFLIASCDYFPEAHFILAEESRLPLWYDLPKGLTRKDVSLELYSYVHKDVFFLKSKRGKQLSKLETKSKTEYAMNSRGDKRLPNEYPFYVVVSVGTVVDITEHRGMNNLLYMCDDPVVWKALGVPYYK